MPALTIENASLATFDFKSNTGQITIDKALGVVEAFVSAIGNKDSVGDIVMSGAFNASLKRRKPRVVWGHDWNQPIGKVLEIYEVPASDPRLPTKMRTAGVGGLYAKVQFNLNTERGREAFANVAFYGHDQEWSIGYKTITSAYDPARSANLLKEVELYEVSPVLHGANQLTGTISVKNDDAMSGVTDLRSVLEKLFSNMLKKPVTVRSIDDDSVVIALPDGKLWRAPFSSEDGRMMIGKPVAVREVTSFESIDDDMGDEGEPAMMTVKDFEYSDEMMMPVKGGDDEYSEYGGKKPDFLDDPMTLLLMAYNEMLKLNGAAALRSKTLSLISDLEKFMVSKKPSGDDESGFVIRMKCHPSQVKSVERAMSELPVYMERSANGVDIKFSTKLDHETLLFKTAEALSSLEFEPVFSVVNPSNTLNM